MWPDVGLFRFKLQTWGHDRREVLESIPWKGERTRIFFGNEMVEDESTSEWIIPQLDEINLRGILPATLAHDIGLEQLDETIIKAGVEDPDFL
jgi:hypothetical protein